MLRIVLVFVLLTMLLVSIAPSRRVVVRVVEPAATFDDRFYFVVPAPPLSRASRPANYSTSQSCSRRCEI